MNSIYFRNNFLYELTFLIFPKFSTNKNSNIRIMKEVTNVHCKILAVDSDDFHYNFLPQLKIQDNAHIIVEDSNDS